MRFSRSKAIEHILLRFRLDTNLTLLPGLNFGFRTYMIVFKS